MSVDDGGLKPRPKSLDVGVRFTVSKLPQAMLHRFMREVVVRQMPVLLRE